MEDFARLLSPYRAELVAHCRRMLGSKDDAEDLVQETFLRAWRARDDFEGRSSLRTWLYRIATNACLNELAARGRRPLPSGHPGQAEPDESAPAWPSGQEADSAADPAGRITSRERSREALEAAWRLPARQRAVLILHDVLSWQAREIGELLGMSSTAVHSMLSRARTHLGEMAPADIDAVRGGSNAAILEEYINAFETGDVSALVFMLADDSTASRPATNEVASGRSDILRLLALCPSVGQSRVVPFVFRNQPGVGIYRREEDGSYRAFCLDVLTTSAAGIQRVEILEDRTLFSAFGLPLAYDDVPRHVTAAAPLGVG